MHVQIGVGTVFVQGTKQEDQVEILTAANYETYTITINGKDFQITSDGTATKAEIATALETKINDASFAWVPVFASTSGGSGEFVDLISDFEGNLFTVTVTAQTPANIEVVSGSHVDGSGDQAAIMEDIIDFAEGSSLLPKEQTIGSEVYLSRYWSPINETSDIRSITIRVYSSAAETFPTTVPAGGDWSSSDVTIGPTEVAEFDTLRVTVELV